MNCESPVLTRKIKEKLFYCRTFFGGGGGPARARLSRPIKVDTEFPILSGHVIKCLMTAFSRATRENM